MSVQIIENYEVMIQNVNNPKASDVPCDKRRIGCFIGKMAILYIFLLIITHLILYYAIPCNNNAKRNVMNLSCD